MEKLVIINADQKGMDTVNELLKQGWRTKIVKTASNNVAASSVDNCQVEMTGEVFAFIVLEQG